MTEAIARPHALYRFYDAAGALLYVGITVNLPTRLTRHRDDKPWWTEVARITVEHHANRNTVLAAERHTILAEKPRHNIQHNTGQVCSEQPHKSNTPKPHDHVAGVPNWTFSNTKTGTFTRTGPLWLYWEVHHDPISDDWLIRDIPADELWRIWLTRSPRDEHAESLYGPGAFGISWFIEGTGTLEAAPFQAPEAMPFGNFLTHYTWPVHPETRVPLQWSRLPVIDKVWRTANQPELYATKGGFIQEATGWKPAPLQPFVDVRQLARSARLYNPADG